MGSSNNRPTYDIEAVTEAILTTMFLGLLFIFIMCSIFDNALQTTPSPICNRDGYRPEISVSRMDISGTDANSSASLISMEFRLQGSNYTTANNYSDAMVFLYHDHNLVSQISFSPFATESDVGHVGAKMVVDHLDAVIGDGQPSEYTFEVWAFAHVIYHTNRDDAVEDGFKLVCEQVRVGGNHSAIMSLLSSPHCSLSTLS